MKIKIYKALKVLAGRSFRGNFLLWFYGYSYLRTASRLL